MSTAPDSQDTLQRQAAEIEQLREALGCAERRRHELEELLADRQQPTLKAPTGSSALAAALAASVACLAQIELPDAPDTPQRVAEALAVLIQTLKRLDQTICSQLEVLGKSNTKIKSLAETLAGEGLLDVEGAVRAVLKPRAVRLTRLHNYTELLLRLWSAILTGVQTTVPEVPNELSQALNPTTWDLEKKRWSSEAEAYWNHFKYVVRLELPLRLGDRMKQIQAHKTLEAYAILGSGQRPTPEQDP